MKRFLFAALLGAAAGVLFAPKKGEETRRKLKQALRDNGLNVDELKTSEGREKIAEAIKDRVQGLKDHSEDFIAGTASSAHAQADDIGHEIEVRVLDATQNPPSNGAADAHQTRKLDDESTPNGSA